MYFHRFLLSLACVIFFNSAIAQQKLYQYTSVPGDPMEARIYTLTNGLKVYLSKNTDEPRIQTQIAVRTGSKNDPSDCTGLAHYLEHMVFKGTSKIASSNWEKEKPLIEEIARLYEKRKATPSQEEKKRIYTQIDSISLLASKYAIPNEYDKMVSSLGASGTNAYTSNEETVYINEIPSNELEKWLFLESERFSELVLRLFHTELEAVYEEYNKNLASDYRKAFQVIAKHLYPTHPLGTQTTIGKGEHLKNPSMYKIKDYFDKYYVPNNMAISLAGDFDYAPTIALIDKYFSTLTAKAVDYPSFEKQQPIQGSITDTIYGAQQEFAMIGCRLPGVGTEYELVIELIDYLLSNGKAGLVDLNLIQAQKVLNAGGFKWMYKDYATFFLYGFAKKGQSLKEVSDLLFEQIDRLKSGNFDDDLLEAVINNMRLEEIKGLESNKSRVSKMSKAFIHQKKWEDIVKRVENLKTIKKEDLTSFAKMFMDNNFIIVHKLNGEDNSLSEVEKPYITPIEINREKKSDFAKNFELKKSEKIEPVFVDYKNQIKEGVLASGLNYHFIPNTTNDLFKLNYIIKKGSNHDLQASFACGYLNYLGTSKYSASDLQKKWYKLGLEFSVSSSRDETVVSLSGLKDSFEEGLLLMEHLFQDVKPDEKALKQLVSDILKSRENAKLDKRTILFKGLVSQAKYGNNSPFKHQLSENELTSLNPDVLIKKIKDLFNYTHTAFYYGHSEKDLEKVSKHHTLSKQNIEFPKPIVFIEKKFEKSQVLFASYDMVQTELLMLSKGPKLDLKLLPEAYVFNQYFGRGLSSIVFQEIREAKALAYSAFSQFSSPSKKEESHYVSAYIGTQADKLNEALMAIRELMNEMPTSESQFQQAKQSALKQIETNRITKSSIFWSYKKALKWGIEDDYREALYSKIKELTIHDLEAFFNTYIKGQKYQFLLIGKKENLDFEMLNKLGPVREMTLEQVFGY